MYPGNVSLDAEEEDEEVVVEGSSQNACVNVIKTWLDG